LAKEGLSFIISVVLFSSIMSLGSWVSKNPLLIVVTVICWLFVIFSIYFFRDPARQIPDGKHTIVSPGDGKIISIEDVFEPEFFQGTVKRISIFLSVFSVHVNRIPMDGKVVYFNYHRGKFFPAFKEKASLDNEQTVIGIENDRCKLLFKQIAGIIARRIVCNVREGQEVIKGQRFGMIKFGSRVDIFLPAEVQITVKLNEHVTGGSSIIGIIHEK